MTRAVGWDVPPGPPQGGPPAEGIPGARYLELPSGHLPMVEALPQLREAVLEFVKG
ncbi:hypothetical protein AB0F71_07590 [Kitasatospora sp. NPDC028055]|uniref:hypothetical protein n=1 Tax=Kitasatospora sp. NPDC028055 TaxID=3155653 RepID=UPI0033EBAE6F